MAIRIPAWWSRILWAAGMAAFLAVSVLPIGETPLSGMEDGDKIAHFGVFFILAFFPVATACVSKRTVVILLLAVAVVSETLQSMIPYRSWEILDIAADLLGLAVGLAAGSTVVRIFSPSEHRD